MVNERSRSSINGENRSNFVTSRLRYGLISVKIIVSMGDLGYKWPSALISIRLGPMVHQSVNTYHSCLVNPTSFYIYLPILLKFYRRSHHVSYILKACSLLREVLLFMPFLSSGSVKIYQQNFKLNSSNNFVLIFLKLGLKICIWIWSLT